MTKCLNIFLSTLNRNRHFININQFPEVVLILGQQSGHVTHGQIHGLLHTKRRVFCALSRGSRGKKVWKLVQSKIDYNSLVSSVQSVCPIIWTGKICCVHLFASKYQDSTPGVDRDQSVCPNKWTGDMRWVCLVVSWYQTNCPWVDGVKLLYSTWRTYMPTPLPENVSVIQSFLSTPQRSAHEK